MGKSTLEDSTVQFRKYGDGISVNNATVKYSFSFDNPGINYTFFVSAKNASNFRLNDSKPVTCTIGETELLSYSSFFSRGIFKLDR